MTAADGPTDSYPLYLQTSIVTVIVCLVLLAILVVLFHLYTQYCQRRRHPDQRTPGRGILFVIASPVSQHDQNSNDEALERSVIEALPWNVYKRGVTAVVGGGDRDTEASASAAMTVECVVCLCNLEEGEIVRALPNCRHTFHLDCIDTWLRSHSTCPVCRMPVMIMNRPEQHVAVQVM